MAKVYYSAARGGFFHEASTRPARRRGAHPGLRHARLMGAQSEGRQIIADARAAVLAPVRVPGLEELRAQAIRALAAEAERRILALASLARQSNDNALIAQAALAQASGKQRPKALPMLARAPPSTPCAPRHPHRRDRHDARLEPDPLRRAAARLWGRLTWPKSRNSRSSPNPMAPRPSWCSRTAWPSACRARP
jgi:hypothetical protein